MSEEVKCAVCGEGCGPDEDWTEEDALAELEENFGAPVDDCDVVCDDCYN